MALVAFQCAVNYLYALVMGRTVLKQGEDTTKSSFYACASFTYLLAMVTSNKALSWVNYPTQVIGKSCKPIPVMVLGVLIGRKKYPALKYLFILMIVAGVALFMYKDSAAQKSWIPRRFDRGGGAAALGQSHMRRPHWGCPGENEGRTWYKVWPHDARHEQVEHWLPPGGASVHR